MQGWPSPHATESPPSTRADAEKAAIITQHVTNPTKQYLLIQPSIGSPNIYGWHRGVQKSLALPPLAMQVSDMAEVDAAETL